MQSRPCHAVQRWQMFQNGPASEGLQAYRMDGNRAFGASRRRALDLCRDQATSVGEEHLAVLHQRLQHRRDMRRRLVRLVDDQNVP